MNNKVFVVLAVVTTYDLNPEVYAVCTRGSREDARRAAHAAGEQAVRVQQEADRLFRAARFKEFDPEWPDERRAEWHAATTARIEREVPKSAYDARVKPWEPQPDYRVVEVTLA